MEYYFTRAENVTGDILIIKGDEFKHLAKVLRKSTGDVIYVTDGNKNLFKSQIQSILKDSIKCKVIEKQYNVNEPDAKVTLYPALLKNPARFEFIIEKSVELGVNKISPVVTSNVISKSRNKTERWQSIALTAMKQSQRCFLPEIISPVEFEIAISAQEKDNLKIIADERRHDTNIGADELERLVTRRRNVSVFTGPEGGFTPEEIDAAVKKGFAILNLGERKLRSETAAVAIMSLILAK